MQQVHQATMLQVSLIRKACRFGPSTDLATKLSITSVAQYSWSSALNVIKCTAQILVFGIATVVTIAFYHRPRFPLSWDTVLEDLAFRRSTRGACHSIYRSAFDFRTLRTLLRKRRMRLLGRRLTALRDSPR